MTQLSAQAKEVKVNNNNSIHIIQWNPSITDTIGTSKLVLLIEVSFVEGHNEVSKWDKKSVPCVEVSFIRGSTVIDFGVCSVL